MEHPDLAAWCMGAVKSALIVVMVLTFAALFRRHSAVARCWILRFAFPALVMAAFWQFGAGWLPVIFVRIEAPAERRSAPMEKERIDLAAMLRETDAAPYPREMFVPAPPIPDPQGDIFMPYGEPKPQELPVVVEDPPPAAAALPLPRYSYTPASVPAAVVPAVPFREIIVAALDRWLSSAWYGVALLVMAWLSIRHFIGLLWLRSRGKTAGETISTTGDALTDALGMKRAIYREVPGLASPLLTGWLRGRLWLPEGTSAMPETQIRSILHHELAHHRRKDLPWQQFASFACAIWWWNPLVWMLRKRLRHEAELAADEVVVAGDGGHATDYAEALVKVARGWTAGDTRILRRTGVPMMGNTSAIERRVRAILADHPLRNRMGWTAGVAVFFIAILGMGVASLTAIAQSAEPAPLPPVVVGKPSSRAPELPLGREPWRPDGEPGMQTSELRSLIEQRRDRTPDYLHPPSTPWMSGPSDRPMDLDQLQRLDQDMKIQWLDWQSKPDYPEIRSGAPRPGEKKLFPDEIRLEKWTPDFSEPYPFRSKLLDEWADRFLKNQENTFETRQRRLPQPIPPPADPNRPEIILFRFTHWKTGEPVPGVKLRVMIDNGEAIDTQSGPDGSYLFTYPENGFSWLVVDVAREGFASQQIRFGKKGFGWIFPDEWNVKMQETSPISGRIVNDFGEPVAEASVKAKLDHWSTEHNGQGIGVGMQMEGTAETNAAGEWRMEGFPQELKGLTFTVSHPDYPEARIPTPHRFLTGQDDASLRDGTSLIKLDSPPRIFGKVIDYMGNPVVNARLATAADLGERQSLSTRTDFRGEFLLTHWKLGGTVRFLVQAEELAPAVHTFKHPQRAPVIIRLERPAILRGRILQEDGSPAAGIEVTAASWRGSSPVAFSTRTDAEGRFTWDSAPAEALPFHFTGATAGKRASLWGHPLRAEEEEQVIILKPALRMRGTAVDDATGEPILQFKLTPGGEMNRALVWRKSSSAGAIDGRAEWETQVHEEQGYRFLIEAEGYEPLTTEAFPTKQQTIEQVWRLKRK